MILSKQNLELHVIASVDRGIPVLNNVLITKEGATVASNSKSVMVVGPITDTIKNSLPLQDSTYQTETVIPASTAREIVNALPTDIQFGGLTEHTVVSDKEGELEFVMTDGRRKKILKGKRYERPYIAYQDFLKKMFKGGGRKLILNRKRLLILLQVMEKICSDKTGHSLIYFEVTDLDEIVLRSFNPRTGQSVASFMSSYKSSEEEWITDSSWEKQWRGTAKISK